MEATNQMKSAQVEKGRAFRALHEREGAFIIPNPWDVGSACLLEHMGFEALATTSMGYAFSQGRTDVIEQPQTEHKPANKCATNRPSNLVHKCANADSASKLALK